MALLGVNIDHVATLRQARGTSYPDPILAAKIAQDVGADQITCHLREDRRHIQDQDLPRLKKALSIPLNLEMAATAEMLQIALDLKPYKVTLVPEKRQELTTEGGLNLLGQTSALTELIKKLQEAGIRLSLFIDPESSQIAAAQELAVEELEFHTGNYCEATSATEQAKQKARLHQAAKEAAAKGFYVAAGHGINYQNILEILKIKEIKEFNIGHSMVAHALMLGWEKAVQEMKALLAGES